MKLRLNKLKIACFVLVVFISVASTSQAQKGIDNVLVVFGSGTKFQTEIIITENDITRDPIESLKKNTQYFIIFELISPKFGCDEGIDAEAMYDLEIRYKLHKEDSIHTVSFPESFSVEVGDKFEIQDRFIYTNWPKLAVSIQIKGIEDYSHLYTKNDIEVTSDWFSSELELYKNPFYNPLVLIPLVSTIGVITLGAGLPLALIRIRKK